MTLHPDFIFATYREAGAGRIVVLETKGDQGITPGFQIRDTDTKFSPSFDTVWASEVAWVIRIPYRAPTSRKRPLNSRLDCRSLSALNLAPPDWRADLQDVTKELEVSR
ncbi:MAG: hypothetical protein JJU07_05805 [Natronohydrobacter sp.]|nr:hypothetical protein [Natronohydrobacter sp.]